MVPPFRECRTRWSAPAKSKSTTTYRAEKTGPGGGTWAPCAKSGGQTPKGSKSCDHCRNFDAISMNSCWRRRGRPCARISRKKIDNQAISTSDSANSMCKWTCVLLACVLWFRVQYTRISLQHSGIRPPAGNARLKNALKIITRHPLAF